jgi:hypothetical protein
VSIAVEEHMAPPDNYRSSEFVPLDQEQEALDVEASSVFSLWELVARYPLIADPPHDVTSDRRNR